MSQALPGLSKEKLKAGVLNGPEIRSLIRDENFVRHQNSTERAAWQSFVAVVD